MKMSAVLAAAAMLGGLAGCTGDSLRADGQNDPYESTNRSAFASHQTLYKNVIRPAAVFYNDTVPEPARDGVHNFLVNLDLPATFANDLLQGEFVRSGDTLGRFTINSTVGIGGILDVAGDIGIPEHETDFGDTLAVYGVGEGPYLYLPVFGPSVPRELAGKLVDSAFDPLTYVTYGSSIFVDLGRAGATYLDKRARGVASADEVERVADDPYVATRDFYRKHLEAEAGHSDSGFDEHQRDIRLAAQETAVASSSPSTTEDTCASVAQSRAQDAAANGDGDLQQAVHDGVYKDCVSWKTAHSFTN